MNNWAAGTGLGSQDLVQRTDGGMMHGDRMQSSTWKGGGSSRARRKTDPLWRRIEKRDTVQEVLVLSSWLSMRCSNWLLDLYSRAMMKEKSDLFV